MARLHAFIELSRDEITAMIADLALGDVDTITPLSAGIINTNYRFTAGGREYLLRLYPPQRDAAALQFECSTLARLTASAFPCPRMLADGHGRSFRWSEAHGRWYAVLEYIAGQNLAREAIDAGIVVQIGRLFADMQRILTDFVPEGAKPSADLAFVRELGEQTTARLAALGERGSAVAQRLRGHWERSYALFRDRDDLGRGVVHADLYFDNVIVVGDRVAGIIDFDDSYYGLFLIDLAVVVMEFGFVSSDRLDFELAGLLLREYFRGRPSARSEAHLLHDGMICACFKYLGYTSNLPEYAGAALLNNEYIARIEYLADLGVRARVEALVAAAMED
jgi:homoserine kinase type II